MPLANRKYRGWKLFRKKIRNLLPVSVRLNYTWVVGEDTVVANVFRWNTNNGVTKRREQITAAGRKNAWLSFRHQSAKATYYYHLWFSQFAVVKIRNDYPLQNHLIFLCMLLIIISL